jgi:hypothetical protein
VSVEGESVGGTLGESVGGGDESLLEDDGGGVDVSVDVDVDGDAVGLVEDGVAVAVADVGPTPVVVIVVAGDVALRAVRRPAEELRAVVALPDVLEVTDPLVDAAVVDPPIVEAPLGAATTLFPKSEDVPDCPVGVAMAGCPPPGLATQAVSATAPTARQTEPKTINRRLCGRGLAWIGPNGESSPNSARSRSGRCRPGDGIASGGTAPSAAWGDHTRQSLSVRHGVCPAPCERVGRYVRPRSLCHRPRDVIGVR